MLRRVRRGNWRIWGEPQRAMTAHFIFVVSPLSDGWISNGQRFLIFHLQTLCQNDGGAKWVKLLHEFIFQTSTPIGFKMNQDLKGGCTHIFADIVLYPSLARISILAHYKKLNAG